MKIIPLIPCDLPVAIINAEALTEKTLALDAARKIAKVNNADEQALAVPEASRLKGLLKQAEDDRVEVKAPFLKGGTAIDTAVKSYSLELALELKRINDLINSFQTSERLKAEAAERACQAELVRIEAARQNAEREAQKKIADAEAASKKALESAAVAVSPEAKAIAIADANEANDARIEAAHAQTRRNADAELAASKANVILAPAPVSVAAGMTVRHVWKWEVIDLYELNRYHPDLVTLTPKTREINEAIKSGRQFYGLKTWKEIETNVRK